MKIDIRRLIADFGGAAALATGLSDLMASRRTSPALGPSPSTGKSAKSVTPAAVYKWQTRGTIPGTYIEQIVQLARASGKAFDLNDYLNAGNTTGSDVLKPGSADSLSPISTQTSTSTSTQADVGQPMRALRIHDASVCECEHGLGIPVDARSKALIAQKLDQLGVDIIEAAFIPATGALPRSGIADSLCATVQTIAAAVERAQISVTVPVDEGATTLAAQALQGVAHERRRICIAVSIAALHQASHLRQLLRTLATAQKQVASVEIVFIGATQFSAELGRWIERCIDQGAETITLSDAAGRQLPEKMGELIRAARARVKNADRVVWSVRCQNDLGLATANALAALRAGVGQIQCSIGGLGERAGITPLEEVIMTARAYPTIFAVRSRINTAQLAPTSRLIAMLTGYPVPANKALIGNNVFGRVFSLAPPSSPEASFIDPDTVGWGEPETRIGHLSGRSAFKEKLDTLGIRLGSEENLSKAFFRFKDLARRKREIFDEDIYAMFLGTSPETEAEAETPPYRLVAHKVVAETGEDPFAEVVLCRDETEIHAQASGSGSIDALFRALEEIVASGGELISYSVNAVTRGSDSQAEVTVRLKYAGYLYCGLASDTDTIAASAEAYLAAVNHILGVHAQTRAAA